MSEQIAHVVDRSKWPAGPWDGEPDYLSWTDEETGLPCLMVRVAWSGHLCGYVAVEPGHPLHGKGYDDVDVNVHWGLTYADACQGNICHVPEPGKPDNVWWFGFDCAHCDDLSPRDAMYARDRPEWYWRVSDDKQYRTAEFVQRECADLARQLASLA